MKVFIAIAVVVFASVCVNAYPNETTAKVEEKPKGEETSTAKVDEEKKQTDELAQKIEEQRKRAAEHVDICVKEVGVDAEVAKNLTFGDFSNKDEKAQCFVNCFFKRTGFMNEAGEPQKDVMIEKLSNKAGVKYEKLEELIEKCLKESVETNQCEKAFKIFECYWTGRVVTAVKSA